MAILDQVELFKNSDFSGSYTDRVFRNAMPFLSYSIGIDTFRMYSLHSFILEPPETDLFKIPSYSKSSNINGQLIPFLSQSDDNLLYLEQRDAYLTKGRRAGKNRLTDDFFSNNEFYIDSLLQSPLEVQNLNKGGFAVVDPQGAESYDLSTILFEQDKSKISFISNERAAVMYVANSSFLTTSSLEFGKRNKIIDYVWHCTYPFEKRYNSLPRYRKPTFSTEQLGTSGLRTTYSVIGSNFESDNNFGGISTDIFSIEDIGEQDNTFDKVVNITFISSGSNIPNQGPSPLAFGQFNSYININQSNVANPFEIYDLQPTTLEENFRLYFGFGTAILKTTGFKNFEPFDFVFPRIRKNFHFIEAFQNTEASRGALSLMGISGYKYGVINHLPFPTKLTFRRGRYGQFRDLLEQRLLSKMYDNKREEPLEAVAVARFLPGTEADIVSKTGYISTEPGYFNREYQSFKPFADDVFPTFIEEEPLSNELVIV